MSGSLVRLDMAQVQPTEFDPDAVIGDGLLSGNLNSRYREVSVGNYISFFTYVID